MRSKKETPRSQPGTSLINRPKSGATLVFTSESPAGLPSWDRMRRLVRLSKIKADVSCLWSRSREKINNGPGSDFASIKGFGPDTPSGHNRPGAEISHPQTPYKSPEKKHRPEKASREGKRRSAESPVNSLLPSVMSRKSSTPPMNCPESSKRGKTAKDKMIDSPSFLFSTASVAMEAVRFSKASVNKGQDLGSDEP
jgi:hypothetical protein